MEQKSSSSHRRGDLSASDSDSDPDREFSGDDDDDRNHKHRRRDIRPQSSEFDALQSVSSKPFNKLNKPFQNGNSFRGNGSRVNGGWKNNKFTPSESELLKPDRRHFDMPLFSRPHMDMNQRIGLGPTYFGDSGFARGRGRDSWNAHAPRFGMDFSQAANHGSVSSNLYAGRGLPNFSGVHISSWNPYGLLPGIPSGGIDAVHSLGINSSLGPPINTPSTGIIHQKCRDFEERGFCLRGDMCPMEHGVNRIVVDDVQSLSKFNLPVSIPPRNGLGVSGGSGSVPAGTASACLSVNDTKIHRKMVKSKTARKGTNGDSVGTFSSLAAAGNDFYDPDQPLLNKNNPESSTALSQPCSPEIQQEEPILGGDPASENPDEVRIGSGIYPLSGSACSDADAHNLAQSSLESLHGAGSRSEMKGKVIMMSNLAGHNNYIQNKEGTTLSKNQTTSAQGIYVLSENKDTNVMDASQRRLKGSSRNIQKPPQKAMRTIFVNGIPQKDKNIEALRSHFQKFGEIIDIYIPSSGEKAFVQFSTREEAEAALKAPDAVMGNRFIKLWWADRDSVPDTGISGGNNPHMNPLAGTAYSGPTPLSVSSKGRSNQLPALKANASHAPSSIPWASAVSSTHINMADQGKHVIGTGTVALAPSQKKLENLEVLKEELRKKQDLLEQKRNEFKRQLEKLEKQKQPAGVKNELSSEQPAKRHKIEMTADVVKRIAPQSADISTSVTLPEAVEVAEKLKPTNKPLVQYSNTGSTLLSQPTTSPNVINLTSADRIEPMDVDTASQNNVLQKENVLEPVEDSKATIKDITDKVVVPNEKPTSCEEPAEGQPSVYDKEKACSSRSTKDVVKQVEQLSEDGGVEKSYNEDSVKTLGDHDNDEDVVRAHDKHLSNDELSRSYEECPSHIHVDYMIDEHSIEEVEEKTPEYEDKPSENDAM